MTRGKGATVEFSKEFKTPVQAIGHATATIILDEMLRNEYTPARIFATAVLLLEHALVYAKMDEAAKLKLVDNIRTKLREAIETNCSELSDEDLEEFRRHFQN
jgi:hypothetical protein